MSLRNIKLCLTFREYWDIVFQMKAYKLKSFNRFARHERIPDQSLRDALEDVVEVGQPPILAETSIR